MVGPDVATGNLWLVGIFLGKILLFAFLRENVKSAHDMPESWGP